LVEDPTRVFRAYRFALRLGFKLSKETERLIKKALELGFVGKLEGGRVLKELGLIAYEPKAIEIVEKLGSEGVLRVIAPELDITPEKSAPFKVWEMPSYGLATAFQINMSIRWPLS